MKYLNILAALFLTVAFTSCEKELDFTYHDIEPLMVIEGDLSTDGINVSLTLTTPMDEPMDRSHLTDASVTLYDLTDNREYTLTPDRDGVYCSPTGGITGHDYQLAVDRDGERRTATATMYAPTEIISLEFRWVHMPYDEVAVLQGEFKADTEADQCYWVKLYRNGEIYQWAEMDSRSAIDGVNRFITMTTRKDTDEEDDDSVLFDGDVITCSIIPVSREMHDYLEARKNGSNGPQMFSGEKCLGYFIAGTPVSKSIVFHPDEIMPYE